MLKKTLFAGAALSLLLAGCTDKSDKTPDEKKVNIEENADIVITPSFSEGEMEVKALDHFGKNYPSFNQVFVREVSLTHNMDIPSKEDQEAKTADVFAVILHFSPPEDEKDVLKNLSKEEQELMSMKASEIVYFYDVTDGSLLFETVMMNEEVLEQIDKMNQDALKGEHTHEEKTESSAEDGGSASS